MQKAQLEIKKWKPAARTSSGVTALTTVTTVPTVTTVTTVTSGANFKPFFTHSAPISSKQTPQIRTWRRENKTSETSTSESKTSEPQTFKHQTLKPETSKAIIKAVQNSGTSNLDQTSKKRKLSKKAKERRCFQFHQHLVKKMFAN